MYIGLSLGFLYGRYYHLLNLVLYLKKLTNFRLAMFIIDKPHSLNTHTITFHFLSISDFERFSKIPSPLSL